MADKARLAARNIGQVRVDPRGRWRAAARAVAAFEGSFFAAVARIMSELHHECGVAAVYHLPGEVSPLCPFRDPLQASRLIPQMLLDIQNRGQLAAGMTAYHPKRPRLLETHKDVGSVNEVFRVSHRAESEELLRKYAGPAAIGHVRYATCGPDSPEYAQPFELYDPEKQRWFAFGFNGQLSNYEDLKRELESSGGHHLTRENDTEVILHELRRQLETTPRPNLLEMTRRLSARFDGAYSLAFLNAAGDMLVARDPLGIKPMCYAKEGNLFAAASESVALLNLGFKEQNIRSLEPGEAITITQGKFELRRFADSPRRAHCFFEWIYFANVASTLDDRSVYLSRTRLGEELARIEQSLPGFNWNPADTIVVPVPDTSKAAADAMAYRLNIPCREGLIRNRYAGRTFIESGMGRRKKAETKYTPLREVLEGKRVILVEDSIVRATTMQVLLERLRVQGGAREVHVRVACPPIIAPCYYGIDMSTIGELFAARFMRDGALTEAVQAEMAAALGADSLRYLPVRSIARAIGLGGHDLCQACITGDYPTSKGRELYQIDVAKTLARPAAAPIETAADLALAGAR